MANQSKNKSDFRYKSVRGMNSMTLNKVLEFVTGEKAANWEYDEEEKEHTFYVKEKYCTDEPLTITKKELMEHFADFFGVNVKKV